MHIIMKNLMAFVFLATLSCVACKSNSTKSKEKDNDVIVPSPKSFIDSLPQSIGYINDFDSLFTPEQTKEFEKLLSDFEKKTTIEIAVVTLDTLMTSTDSLHATTLKIANYWGVGKKDKNNGVVIGICRGCRKMVIQNGYGIEKGLSKKETDHIIATGFVQGFINDNFYEGTIVGLRSLIEVLEEKIRLKLIE